MNVVNLSNATSAEGVNHLQKVTVVHSVCNAFELKNYFNLLFRSTEVIFLQKLLNVLSGKNPATSSEILK